MVRELGEVNLNSAGNDVGPGTDVDQGNPQSIACHLITIVRMRPQRGVEEAARRWICHQAE